MLASLNVRVPKPIQGTDIVWFGTKYNAHNQGHGGLWSPDAMSNTLRVGEYDLEDYVLAEVVFCENMTLRGYLLDYEQSAAMGWPYGSIDMKAHYPWIHTITTPGQTEYINYESDFTEYSHQELRHMPAYNFPGRFWPPLLVNAPTPAAANNEFECLSRRFRIF